MSAHTAYVTTPIYYPSGKPHLGSAYTSLAADVYARYMRMAGVDTYFLTGTDEHGLKLQRAAEKEGKTPQAYVDEMSALFRTLTPMMGLSNDDFIRTTETRHKAAVQEMWGRLERNGYIYKSNYAGWYCVSDEAYYADDEIVTDASGTRRSPVSGHPLEWMEEESYFLKLSAFGDRLIDLYTKRPELIRPESRLHEVLGFLKQGLEDISISRTTFNWGVSVPGNEKHVMYVWIDALTNYLSALGWPQGEKMRYWPALHLVGKDILRFHAVYWPAMLLGAGLTEDQLPTVFAHGWWTVEGAKMSKSKGNVVDPEALVAEFGLDPVRYFLLREVPFGGDGDFSRPRLISRINRDLANDLGNLFQRVLSIVTKNNDGKTPDLGTLTDADKAFLAFAGKDRLTQYKAHMEALAFHKALDVAWEIIGEANRYMDAQKPWELKKTDPARMLHVLRVLMEVFCTITIMVKPFMPASADRLQTQLGWTGTLPDLETTTNPRLTTGTQLPAPQGVFMRIQEGTAAA